MYNPQAPQYTTFQVKEEAELLAFIPVGLIPPFSSAVQKPNPYSQEAVSA